jgi:glycosyltransferase involved in cell wall biosynthesis
VRKKHILFIVENNPVPRDIRVWNEARAVKELGHEVSIICPTDDRGKDTATFLEGIRIYRHPRTPEKQGRGALIREYANALFWEFLLSLRLFVTHRFDVIHSANPPDHIFLIALPFKLFGVKYVFDHHDLTPETYMAKFGRPGLLFKLLLLMERLTYKTADLVVATNESYKKVAQARGGKRPEDVAVVRNGPTLTALHDVSPKPALREGFAYLVGYVGVIGQQDQVENIVDIAEEVVRVKGRTDVKFVIVGTGPDLQSIIRQCHERNLDGFVEFTGYIPDRDFYDIMATSDVCINPEFGNPFTDKSTMMKVMEYMAVGRPIVQFYTTEGEFSAGEASVYVRENRVDKFAQALLDLLADPERRARMGAFGRKRVEESLEWPKQKEHLKAAYRRLLPA